MSASLSLPFDDEPSEAPNPDPFDLERFVGAQERTYALALAELRSGRKQGHWMWFIFPQLAGLSQSWMARRYALQSAEEARAFAHHPILGPRLRECAEALLELEGADAQTVLGTPDDVKLRSCATLFALVRAEETAFEGLLEKYFAGEKDPLTLGLLGV